MDSEFFIDRNVGRDEWEACAEADPLCTIFQTPRWTGVLVQAGIARSARVVAARFDGRGSILVPIAEMWRGRISGLFAYESMPLSAYGGPIVSGGIESEELSRALTDICFDWRLAAQSVVITGAPGRKLNLTGAFARRTLHAHILEVASGADEVIAGYNQNFRRGLKVARKAGVSVRFGNSLEDLLTYYSLYEHSLRRWGADATSHHRKELFSALLQLPEGCFRVWIGEVQRLPVAGIVMLYKGDTAYYWHGAFHGDHSHQMPSKAVFHAAIIDIIGRGYKRLDMLSSGGHEGVVQFKESMGAKPHPFDEFAWAADGKRRLAVALRSNLLHAASRW